MYIVPDCFRNHHTEFEIDGEIITLVNQQLVLSILPMDLPKPWLLKTVLELLLAIYSQINHWNFYVDNL